jgi:hypothetical protein
MRGNKDNAQSPLRAAGKAVGSRELSAVPSPTSTERRLSSESCDTPIHCGTQPLAYHPAPKTMKVRSKNFHAVFLLARFLLCSFPKLQYDTCEPRSEFFV